MHNDTIKESSTDIDVVLPTKTGRGRPRKNPTPPPKPKHTFIVFRCSKRVSQTILS